MRLNEQFVEDVYNTIQGILIPQAQVQGVENLFAPGEKCAGYYEQMLDACQRLCHRLGVEDEDEDVEVIIWTLREMTWEISRKMYHYGAKFERFYNKCWGQAMSLTPL